MSISVVLADDHEIIRNGLRSLLEKETDIQVVGEAQDGRTAVRLAKDLNPDVIVMDVSMPDLNGIEATREISSRAPRTRVLGLSMHSDRRFVARMLQAGAAGYLLKECAYDEFVRAVRTVASGKTYLSPGVTDGIVEAFVRRPSAETPAAASVLTPRQREVLQLVAEGRATKQIAARLHVSAKTVDTHRHEIMNKLDLHSIAELTKFAVREGLTDLET